MSSSGIYGIRKDYTGEEIFEYKNSWWFSPIIWSVLPDKYIHDYIQTPFGFKKGIIGMDGNDVWTRTNKSINECDNTPDRVCWEMSNQQIFHTSDKQIISDSYKENPNAHYIAYDLEYISLTSDDIYTVWNTQNERWIDHAPDYFSFLNKLVDEFGYNAKDLWLYLDRIKTFEAIEDMSYLIRELYDYANMMRQLSLKYDKYPRNFLTTHRIACRNYNRMKKEFSEELFKKRINKQYECSFGDYIFIYPESTQDIKDEATMQNNCVASYIDKVIDGECHILFLRKKNKPDESLVTIEVRNNHIVQARRRFNDDVTAEDQKAIDAFNKKFKNKEDKVA